MMQHRIPGTDVRPSDTQNGSPNSETCETGSLVSALLSMIVSLNYMKIHKFHSLSTHFSSSQHTSCLLKRLHTSIHLMLSQHVSFRLKTLNAFSTLFMTQYISACCCLPVLTASLHPTITASYCLHLVAVSTEKTIAEGAEA